MIIPSVLQRVLKKDTMRYMSEGVAAEIIFSPEIREQESAQRIAVTTSTMYGKGESDRQRVKTSLNAFRLALKKGHHVVVVDGGSTNAEYLSGMEALSEEYSGLIFLTAEGHDQELSASRRKALKRAEQLREQGVDILWTVEPEKISLIEKLVEMSQPLLDKESDVDIVIPHRSTASLETYPDYQAQYEIFANVQFDRMLQEDGLLPKRDPYVPPITEDELKQITHDEVAQLSQQYRPSDYTYDAWFGVRGMRNDPKVVEMFLNNFGFNSEQGDTASGKPINPEMWADALFLSIPYALANGLHVASVPIEYEHPKEQTNLEVGQGDTFLEKRRLQLQDILTNFREYTRWKNGETTRLFKRVPVLTP